MARFQLVEISSSATPTLGATRLFTQRSPRALITANLNGWEGSVEGKFLPWFGIAADIDGHYGSHDLVVCPAPPLLPPCAQVNIDTRRYSFLIGPRVSIPA